ncbi:MAG: lipid-A-disaccharide synthase [Muribaculaceae bacterium]|nr:lipid-A-disaccharide synthase [Muribaculaceae bacterium]
MKYFVSAGEASGDLHGASLVREIVRLDSDAEITFLGGDSMALAAGKAPLIHYRDMAFVGFSEVVRHLGKVLGNLKTAKKAIESFRPDALVLIDYPSFNLRLAAYACSLGIPVYYYISPKVWAWKEWRVKDMRRYCRMILSILPFEVGYFRNKGLEVTYVGNPSVEEVDAREAVLPPRGEFLLRHSLPDGKPLLALVPGSRVGEIRNNLPIMDAVARRFPQFTPVIAGAPGIDMSLYSRFSAFPVVAGATFELVRNSSAALVTSGTATLETALLGTPQVVCYRSNGSRLSRKIMERFIKCDFVSLPNLIAGREIVKELLLDRCTEQTVAAELARIMPGTEGRDEMLRGYARMRGILGSSTSASAAATAIISDLRR